MYQKALEMAKIGICTVTQNPGKCDTNIVTTGTY